MTLLRFELPASLLMAFGFPVLAAWLLLSPRIFGRTARLALALPMGLGLVVALFPPLLLLAPAPVAPFLAGAVMLGLGIVSAGRRLATSGSASRPSFPGSPGAPGVPSAHGARGGSAASLLVGTVVLLLFARAILAGPSSETESLERSVRDARDLVAGGLDAGYFQGGGSARIWAPLLSLAEAWLHAILGDGAFRIGRVLPAGMLASSLVLLAADLRERGARTWQAYGLAALLGASPQLVGQATELLPGAILASLILASSISLVAGCARLRPSSFLIAGCPLGLASLAGPEGALASLAMFAGAVVGLAPRRLRPMAAAGRLGLLLTPGAAAWAAWLALASWCGASLALPARSADLSFRRALTLCVRELVSPSIPSTSALLLLALVLILVARHRAVVESGSHLHLLVAATMLPAGAYALTLEMSPAVDLLARIPGATLPSTFLAFTAVACVLATRAVKGEGEAAPAPSMRERPGSTLAPAGPALD